MKLWVNCYSHTKIWGVICPSRYISWTITWISSLTTLVPSVTNTGNVFTKTFLPWKRGTTDRVVQECWLLLDDEEGCSRCQAQKEINNLRILGKVNNVYSMYIYTFLSHLTWLSQKPVGDGEKLLTYLNSALKALLGFDIFPRVPKKSEILLFSLIVHH